MDLHVSLGKARTLTDDVYRQVREAVLSAKLRPGERVPSTRELARRLALARNTVATAYARLTAEGYLVGRVGAGTFVAAAASAARGRRRRLPSLKPRPVWAQIARDAPAPTEGAAFDLRPGAPDPALFPWAEWRRLSARAYRRRRLESGYPPPQGAARLREAIARHIGVARAVTAAPEDVLVCSGAQQAFDLVVRVFLEPGDGVSVEDPGYPAFWRAAAALGARVAPVRVDEEGIVVDELPDDARLVYVTPSHQYPLGTTMSLERRLALLEWSAKRGAAILEDDYDSEFRFGGRPVESLHGLDREDRVLYVGTFSKTLLPTLRIGFVVAPPSLMPALQAAKRLSDSHGHLESQLALADLLAEGAFARHVRRLQRVYAARREALLGAVERHLGDAVAVPPSTVGLHTALLCRDPNADSAAWAARARRLGVAVQPLDGYFRLRRRAGLALGYGMISAERVPEGIARLASCAPGRRPVP